MTVSSKTMAIARKPEIVARAKELSRIDNSKAAWAVARQWIVISATVAAAVWSGHWLVYVLAIIILATRQHALGILMHDACHHRLFTNRKANDIVGNFFCALPVGLTVSRYRDEHNQHHRDPNTERDPYFLLFRSNPRDWDWPKRPLNALGVVIRDVFGLNSLTSSREFSNWMPVKNHFGSTGAPVPLSWGERITTYIFVAVLLAGLWWTNGWLDFAILWVLPYSTVTLMLVRLRTIAEHHGLPEGSGTDATRHIDATWWEALSVSPLNINYHLAHHIFPSIPHYNLPAMTETLFADPEFAAVAHRSTGYLNREGVIRGELLTQ